MPDERRELQTICPASHTTALGGLFIAEVQAVVQQKVWEAARLTDLIRRGTRSPRNLDGVEEMQVSLRLTGQSRRLSPHEPFLSTCSYGNSRVTNLAGWWPVLVRVCAEPPGSHLTSPD